MLREIFVPILFSCLFGFFQVANAAEHVCYLDEKYSENFDIYSQKTSEILEKLDWDSSEHFVDALQRVHIMVCNSALFDLSPKSESAVQALSLFFLELQIWEEIINRVSLQAGYEGDENQVGSDLWLDIWQHSWSKLKDLLKDRWGIVVEIVWDQTVRPVWNPVFDKCVKQFKKHLAKFSKGQFKGALRSDVFYAFQMDQTVGITILYSKEMIQARNILIEYFSKNLTEKEAQNVLSEIKLPLSNNALTKIQLDLLRLSLNYSHKS